MKILHVTNAVEWSGGMEQIALLISGLQKKNQENILVCQPNSKLIERVAPLGIRTELIPMFQDYDLLAAWKLMKFIKLTRPDVVHAHHPVAHAVTLLSLFFSDKPPLVVSRRVSFPPRKNPFSRWKYQARRINKYAVVSWSVQETLVAGGVESSKIEVIYSAVNPEKFFSRKPNQDLKSQLHIPKDYFVVGKVANYSPWKGHQIFLQAIPKCLSRNPKIIFLLVGKDTESLSSLADSLGISQSVRLLGFRKDIPEIFSILDLSVNSAIEGEGLAGTLRESLMMEVPVIASDVAGNKEIVKDGETGILVSAGDVNQLAEKILYAIENYGQVKQMSQKGREWVLQNATIDKMVDNFFKFYSSIVTIV